MCVCVCVCVYIYIYTHMYIHTHIFDCIETAHELPLLPNNTAVEHFYTNSEQCKVLTGYLSYETWPGSDWVNM